MGRDTSHCQVKSPHIKAVSVMPGHQKNELSNITPLITKAVRQNAETVKIDYTTNTYF